MKKIGMIGGLAWPSTIEYYRLICSAVSDYHRKLGASPPYAIPEMVIESANISETRALRGVTGDENSWRGFDQKFHGLLMQLKTAGADFGFIASNTPHMRIKSITRDLDFKVVSILDAMAETSKTLKVNKILILGTAVTMRASVYREVLGDYEIETVPQLPDAIIDEIQYLIDTDFYSGNAVNARDRLLAICREYSDEEDTVISLACTELPLAFPENLDKEVFQYDEFKFINTTVSHANAVIREALS